MSELAMRCPVCEGTIYFLGTDAFDDRHDQPNRYQPTKCVACGLVAALSRLREPDLLLAMTTTKS